MAAFCDRCGIDIFPRCTSREMGARCIDCCTGRPAFAVRRFVPYAIDRSQALDYTLVAYTWSERHGLIARFADGRAVHSIYGTVDALLKAGQDNYLERVREVCA